ncbi:methyltransferase domain protein [Ceratobasidium sp. AG-Ba]|nr:methyltransferase domain protein [Ceratobasidium sp. AG-Ba]
MTPWHEHDDDRHIVVEDNHEIVDIFEVTADQTLNPYALMFSDSGSSNDTMSTIQSDESAGYFRSVHGSMFPSDESIPLLFPTDASADRLDILQHIIIRLCRGGKNIPDSVDEMLRNGGVARNGTGARVLDAVTNSGTWVNEMAETYPTATFTSLDIKPLVPHVPHIRIDFQVYNFPAGILEPDNTFDLVHLRQGVLATKDFNLPLRELHRVLKPGGYIMITKLPFEAYEGNPPVPLRPSLCLSQTVKMGYETCKAEGADIAAWQDMSTRLDPDHPLWENQQPVLDSKEPRLEIGPPRGFDSIIFHQKPIPLGTWHPDEGQKLLGNVMRSYALNDVCSSLPVTTHRVEEVLNESQPHEFIEKLIRELNDIDKYQATVMCHICMPSASFQHEDALASMSRRN